MASECSHADKCIQFLYIAFVFVQGYQTTSVINDYKNVWKETNQDMPSLEEKVMGIAAPPYPLIAKKV